ncbi:unnamed protein product [Vitrella brassicaformis CCMP3155]|uniref:Phosphatidylinositol N-acetylglucosaminyltransferase subunit C n=2 Tax=Vitrella brassicaformis TaxID=1169539 RepID=A0A0G4FJK9_VITBC|nr:unnamed protein product [Vitrella brassicaformis CCMP3155]|mmetsp:Transcript_14322/g.34150  ORF Transcript_14322/g.34150 Transcript_14322/m.34150 type:complete len:344 (+) Transcript_14322:198-1229(+)|eukprot:CEM13808.1 unnamed protein product [Vitrella brassicaformis CCMP3155]
MALFRYCPYDGRKFFQEEVVCPLCKEPRFPLSHTWRFQRERSQDGQRVPWRKILYERQPYDDTHVDITFLDSLITNATVGEYRYWTLCCWSVDLTQPLSCLTLFLALYVLLRKGMVDVRWLVGLDMGLLAGGYVVCVLLRRNKEPQGGTWRALRSAVNIVGFLWMLSPVLQTLTQTYSSDTLYTLTTMFLLLHLAFYDYHFVYGSNKPNRRPAVPGVRPSPRPPSPFGLNAAMFAAVLLASRLNTSAEVFSVVLFAIEMFGLSLILRRDIRDSCEWAYTFVLTPLLVATAYWLLKLVSIHMAFFYLTCILLITFVGPYCFIHSQRYKSEIKGPWDIAEVPSYS